VASLLPDRTLWFDAHTHVGANDPDGFTATAAEVLKALDLAGHHRALIFPFHEPDGYSAANDVVLAEAVASGGRLEPLCRLDPNADPIAEARRCLAAGARGFKLHPRAEGFELHHPEVARIVAIADERRLPVLIHAGRGIPALGRDAVALARAHPGAWIILAHAGISDLSWIWREAETLPNLLFDTAWWSMADLLALFALVPPGQLVYASDTPYGFGLINGLLALRAGLSVGLAPEVLGQIVGGQLTRLLDGGPLADLGPAPGPSAVTRGVFTERVVAHLYGATNRAFMGTDPSEALALAALACEVPPDLEEAGVLAAAADLIDLSAQAAEAGMSLRAVVAPSLVAAALAATPNVPIAT
jgi:predicted TIM-barrel fold metal-dependent hydrolase